MPANLPVLFSALLPLLLLLLCGGAQPVHGKQVSLSNVALPRDTGGHLLYTGEASALAHNGTYYLYFNNWGGCTGVDCCPTAKGCADCCYTKAPFADPCVYTNNHSVVVYRTADFATFEYAGEALPRARRADGIEFRPCVVYNARTRLFVCGMRIATAGRRDTPWPPRLPRKMATPTARATSTRTTTARRTACGTASWWCG